MKYRVPRNVKTGLAFMGLELLGWLYYLPTIIILGSLVYFIPFPIQIKLLSWIFVLALGHVLFQTDEKTGVMNFLLFVERIKWIYSDSKIIEPVWSEEFERNNTIQITVRKERTGDTETGDTNQELN